MNIPDDAYRRIEAEIASDTSPVGIDAKKTHVLILYKLAEIERRWPRSKPGRGEASGMTEAALFEAIRNGDHGAAESALAADPGTATARDETGVSAVMMALYHRQREIAETIAAARHDLDLFELTALGRAEDLELVLSQPGLDLDARSPDGFTALHYAAFFGHPDVVARLVTAGAPVEAVAANPTQVQPLHSAVAALSVDAVRLLLEAGAPVDAPQQRGFTALQGAAHAGHAALVQLLVDWGADPDRQNDEGKSARDLAEGHAGVAELLGRPMPD